MVNQLLSVAKQARHIDLLLNYRIFSRNLNPCLPVRGDSYATNVAGSVQFGHQASFSQDRCAYRKIIAMGDAARQNVTSN